MLPLLVFFYMNFLFIPVPFETFHQGLKPSFLRLVPVRLELFPDMKRILKHA